MQVKQTHRITGNALFHIFRYYGFWALLRGIFQRCFPYTKFQNERGVCCLLTNSFYRCKCFLTRNMDLLTLSSPSTLCCLYSHFSHRRLSIKIRQIPIKNKINLSSSLRANEIMCEKEGSLARRRMFWQNQQRASQDAEQKRRWGRVAGEGVRLESALGCPLLHNYTRDVHEATI